jgi:hypothetical protein
LAAPRAPVHGEFVNSHKTERREQLAVRRENDQANRRPPLPSFTAGHGGTIAAVCSRCRSRRNLRIRHGQLGIAPGLFLAVLFGMRLHGLFGMPSAMNYVAPRGVSVVCRLFVMSGIVVLGGLLVVTGGMLEVF